MDKDRDMDAYVDMGIDTGHGHKHLAVQQSKSDNL
jgi:hypothetical protein